MSCRKERHFEEPYFLPERSSYLKEETVTWHDQHESGVKKISFDFQIPSDLEVYAVMLLHSVVHPTVKRTFDNIKSVLHRMGAFKSGTDSINAYYVIDSPAIDAYRVLVNNDRKSTIGVFKKKRPDIEEPGATVSVAQTHARRWITVLRLYCAIDGYFPHIAQGKWKNLVTHYKMKVINNENFSVFRNSHTYLCTCSWKVLLMRTRMDLKLTMKITWSPWTSTSQNKEVSSACVHILRTELTNDILL